jgi:hypothetical protein
MWDVTWIHRFFYRDHRRNIVNTVMHIKLKLRLKNTIKDNTLTYASDTWILKETESK